MLPNYCKQIPFWWTWIWGKSYKPLVWYDTLLPVTFSLHKIFLPYPHHWNSFPQKENWPNPCHHAVTSDRLPLDRQFFSTEVFQLPLFVLWRRNSLHFVVSRSLSQCDLYKQQWIFLCSDWQTISISRIFLHRRLTPTTSKKEDCFQRINAS